jgi:hypothetical protein
MKPIYIVGGKFFYSLQAAKRCARKTGHVLQCIHDTTPDVYEFKEEPIKEKKLYRKLELED